MAELNDDIFNLGATNPIPQAHEVLADTIRGLAGLDDSNKCRVLKAAASFYDLSEEVSS